MAGRKKRGGSNELEFHGKLQHGGKIEYDPAEVRFKTAKDRQVGGDHYKGMAIQPAEYAHKNGIGFLAGTAIGYISRYKLKGGIQDLEKAIHTLEMLIDLEREES